MKKVITLVITLFASAAYGGCVINPPEYNGSAEETYGYVFNITSHGGPPFYNLEPFMILSGSWYSMEVRPVSYEVDFNGQHVVGDESDTTILILN